MAWTDVTAVMLDDDESGAYAEEKQRKPISERLELASGLVDLGKVHEASGNRRWYGPRKNGSKAGPRLTIRLPATVTCWCGHDNPIGTDVSAVYASGDQEQRDSALLDELADAAADDAADAQREWHEESLRGAADG